MESKQVHFKVDPLWFIGFMIQKEYETTHNDSEEITNARRYALGDIACMNCEFSLTDQEIEDIADKYGEQTNVETIDLTGDPEQRKAFFELMLELPRVNEREFHYILKGHGQPYSVVDRTTNKEYACDHGEHYDTLMNVIKTQYTPEFWEKDLAEQDKFVLDNFYLNGAKYSPSWYTVNRTKDPFSNNQTKRSVSTMTALTKEQVIDKVTDTLSGGELNLLNTATTDFDITTTDLVPAQSFLQGFIFAVRNLTELTDEDINNITVPMDKPCVLTNLELIDYIYQ